MAMGAVPISVLSGEVNVFRRSHRSHHSHRSHRSHHSPVFQADSVRCVVAPKL